ALLDHGARQPRLHALDAVLHLDRRGRGIGPGNEIGDDLDLPERVAGGFEIQDAVGAVELFLDQPRGAVVEVLGRCARITPKFRSDHIAICELLKTIDNDAIARLHAVNNEPTVVDGVPKADLYEARTVVIAHHKDLAAAGIIAADRLLRHRKRIGIDALDDLHPYIHAGQQS